MLISDGNYPHTTRSNPAATRVFLNLAPGVLNVTDVLKVVAAAIPIEAVHVMATADGSEPPIWRESHNICEHDVGQVGAGDGDGVILCEGQANHREV